MPSIAVANGLKLDEIPLPLKDLSSLEVVFISRGIPFMKLLGLPRRKQKAIHGCVVNIQVEPEQTMSVLPRAPTPDSVIAVKLRERYSIEAMLSCKTYIHTKSSKPCSY